MSLSDEQAAFLLDVCKLIRMATDLGYKVTGGELWRTQEQQEIYYKAGKSKTLQSNHMRRLAIDLNFLKDGALVNSVAELEPIGKFWEALHPKNRWGARFVGLVDTPHFERNI